MKKLFILLPILLLLLLALFQRNYIASHAREYIYFSPCETPLRYSIGEIDSRFNLSNDELLRRSKIAAKIWEDAYGKPLFVYDPQSPFTINAIYDERQQLSTETQTQDSKLKEENTEINQNVAAFRARVETYKAAQKQLNEDIRYWNERGGAPEEEYNKLLERQNALENESKELQALAESLNQSSSEFNAQAEAYKETISKFNDVLKEKPEGGIYTQYGDDRQITIYFNNSEQEFIYTLAHEMGHALGLPHVPDSNSIMYPNINSVLTPSEYDLSALKTVCAQRSIFDLMIKNTKRNLQTITGLITPAAK